MTLNAYEFGKRLLQPFDDYLKNNLDQLTCKSVRQLYYGLWNSLKRYTGTSTGFVGFSEFLVFRSLYHVLGGEFVKEPAPESERIYRFKRGHLTLKHENVPSSHKYPRIKPDILLEHADRPVSAVEVKVYLGRTDLEKTVERLRGIHDRNRDVRAATIVFDSPTDPFGPRRSSVRDAIEDVRRDFLWLDIIIMQDPEYQEKPFKDVLSESLGLNRFVS